MRAAPWKSGASAPRKALQNQCGLQPQRSSSIDRVEFFRNLLGARQAASQLILMHGTIDADGGGE